MNHDRLRFFVRDLKEAGLTGMEAVYSMNSPGDERNMKKLAQKFDLLISGGSDFHGENKPYIHLGTGKGNLRIPDSILDAIKAEKERVSQNCNKQLTDFKRRSRVFGRGIIPQRPKTKEVQIC